MYIIIDCTPFIFYSGFILSVLYNSSMYLDASTPRHQ